MADNELKVDNISCEDLKLLFSAMRQFADGSYDEIDVNQFENPTIGELFNEMVNKDVERNNRYLARINDAQLRIGDTSCLKSMFEQIAAQQDAIRILQEARNDITLDDRPMSDINSEFLAASAQIGNAFNPCIEELADTLSLFSNFDIPELDAWSEEKESEETVVLRTMRENIDRTKRRLEAMSRRVSTISDDALVMFDTIDKKTKTNKDFLESVDALTLSYKNLSAECLETGRHLYRISRDIDNARNDMFRHFSRPTLHDRLRVYEVDHVTLAWRLYNNIVEFESLRLTQVNNTQSCKMGLWLASVDDPRIAEAESFHRLAMAHENLHTACVECFVAKQKFNMVMALDSFGEVMDCLKEFQDAMTELHTYLRSIGITDETDVWKFRG